MNKLFHLSYPASGLNEKKPMLLLIVPFIFGAAIGSFLNVCIYRIPLGISIVRPPSACPSCGHRIPFYYNVPVLGYIILGGRCSSCSARFSARYPFIEALTGAAAALLFYLHALTPEFFVYFAFAAALIVITFIDLDHKLIPDVISIPGIAAGFGASFFLPEPGVVNSLIGLVAGGGVLLAVAMGYYLLTGSEGMGGGDIKLLAMIGAFLGWKGVIVTLLAGSLTGAVLGVVFMAAYGKNTKYALPFGPFLAAGALLHLFYGAELIDWYLTGVVGMP